MGGALDQARAAVQELIGQPLQSDASMGAAVLIDEDLSGPSHRQQLNAGQLQATALSFRNITAFAQEFQAGLLNA